jgi:hypothetical protein
MAQMQSGGGVDPNRPSFNPIQQLERAQFELMKFGTPGAKSAENIGILKDKAQARVDAAVAREAEAIGTVADTLLQTPFNDRAVLIDQLARNAAGDKNLERFVTQLKAAKTSEEQDFLLNRWRNKALGTKDAIAARQKQQELDQKVRTDNIASRRVAATESNNELGWAEHQRKLDEEDRRVFEYDNLGEREKEIAAHEMVKKQLPIARENVSNSELLIDLYDDINTQIDNLIAIDAGQTGKRAELSAWVGQYDSDLADKIAEGTGSIPSDQASLLRQAFRSAQLEATKAINLAPVSDPDLRTIGETQADVFTTGSLETLKAKNQAARKRAIGIRNKHLDFETGFLESDDAVGAMEKITSASQERKFVDAARTAVGDGRDPAAVRVRMLENGVDPWRAGLDPATPEEVETYLTVTEETVEE